MGIDYNWFFLIFRYLSVALYLGDNPPPPGHQGGRIRWTARLLADEYHVSGKFRGRLPRQVEDKATLPQFNPEDIKTIHSEERYSVQLESPLSFFGWHSSRLVIQPPVARTLAGHAPVQLAGTAGRLVTLLTVPASHVAEIRVFIGRRPVAEIVVHITLDGDRRLNPVLGPPGGDALNPRGDLVGDTESRLQLSVRNDLDGGRFSTIA